MKHSKHKHHPHDKHAAMSQFHEGHWEKDHNMLATADGKYTSEFGQMEEYEKDVSELASYAKKHKMKY